jgi:ubiquitin carboxyl-terminal hydrolase 8
LPLDPDSDPALRISGKALEESLVLCPGEQQDWFSNRHVFDLVVIYDEESRVNSYAGGPVLDIHQVRLRNLTVAIFDFAGYLKPLKHVPMLLVGGIRAWCNLVRENPLRFVRWDTEHPTRAAPRQSQPSGKSRQFAELGRVERKVDELDLDAESQWLESLHTERYNYSKDCLTCLKRSAPKTTSQA